MTRMCTGRAVALVASMLLPAQPAAPRPNPGGDSGTQFGERIAAIPDMDGDAVPDLVVSDPLAQKTGRVYLYSGKTGKWIRTLSGGASVEGFGMAVAVLGDLDGDQRSDVLAGAYRKSGFETGTLLAYSGASGKLIREIPAIPPSSSALLRLAAMGDIDGDGTKDFVVSDPSGGKGGSVHLKSTKSGSTIFEVEGAQSGTGLGTVIAALGDVDRDGVGDFAAAGKSEDEDGQCPIHVVVYSGKTGKKLHSLGGMKAPNFVFFIMTPPAIAAPGDLNGDGSADIVVGAPFQTNGARENCGMVRAFSGSDGKEIWTAWGMTEKESDCFGFAAVAAGDLDGDGVQEVVVAGGLDTDPAVPVKTSRLYILSGKTGKVVRTIRLPDSKEFLSVGQHLAAAGDLDGDGKSEIAVATLTTSGPDDGTWESRVRVFSGKDGRLVLTLTPPETAK